MSTGMIASLVILFFVLARLLPKVKQFDKHLGSNYLGVMCDMSSFCLLFNRKALFIC